MSHADSIFYGSVFIFGGYVFGVTGAPLWFALTCIAFGTALCTYHAAKLVDKIGRRRKP